MMVSLSQPEPALSPRELQVVALVAEGLSNKLIADRIGVSEHCAKFHILNIMRKLRARSRAHVVTLAVQRGLLNLSITPAIPTAELLTSEPLSDEGAIVLVKGLIGSEVAEGRLGNLLAGRLIVWFEQVNARLRSM